MTMASQAQFKTYQDYQYANPTSQFTDLMKHISEIYQSAKDQEAYEAKMRELNSWREQSVYEEVPREG